MDIVWPGLTIIGLLLLFVRVRVDLITEFECPKCNNVAEGRRCYSCRLEADPDDGPTEMGILEFVIYEVRDFWRVKIRKQRWQWHPF